MARARSAPRRLTRRTLSERSERSERSEFCDGPQAEHRRAVGAQHRPPAEALPPVRARLCRADVGPAREQAAAIPHFVACRPAQLTRRAAPPHQRAVQRRVNCPAHAQTTGARARAARHAPRRSWRWVPQHAHVVAGARRQLPHPHVVARGQRFGVHQRHDRHQVGASHQFRQCAVVTCAQHGAIDEFEPLQHQLDIAVKGRRRRCHGERCARQLACSQRLSDAADRRCQWPR